MQKLWRVRDGRGHDFTLWNDELDDALARINLDRTSINELPPPEPAPGTWSASRMQLYEAALTEYQWEGTRLFDLVRPSLLIDGPYANRDIRLIATWKNGGVKDGRALLRWALSFVDRSSVPDQMKVLKEMNEMRLPPQATLFEMTEHFFRLWELWLSLTTSRREEPASFFQVLLLTMPTEPEGPVVHVRREMAKMIRLNESPLLLNIDGEKGLFAAMESFGEELGMSKAVPSTLNALNGGGGGMPVSGAGDDKTTKCDECRAFACKKQDNGKCICKHDSKFPLSSIEQKGRRDFVALMRRYNKANPGKSLQVKVKVVREALGEAPKDDKKEKETSGKVAFMASVKSVLGDEASDTDAVDKWLEEHADGEFFVLGDTADVGNGSAVGELQFQVVEDDVKDDTARELALDDASGSGSGTSKTSNDSARTASELMAHEIELERMKSKLMMANARVSELEAKERAAAAAAPAAAPTPVTAKKPNPALDPPKRMSLLQMTPKQIYQKVWSSPEEPDETPATAAPPSRQKYTPKEAPILENMVSNDSSTKGKVTSTEYFARGVVAAETEKRQKVSNKSKVQLKALGEVLLYGHINVYHFAKRFVVTTWSECTTHGILTSSLLVVVFGPYVKPVTKFLLTKLGTLAAKFTLARLKDAIEGMRALLRNFAAAVVAKLVALALRQATPPTAAAVAHSVHTARGTSTGADPSPAPALTRTGSTTIDGGDHGGTLMSLGEHLGNSVLMTKSELVVEDGLKPGLMDDGASSNTSCAKTLDGAIPGTYLATDAGNIGLGSDGATLASEGSYLYALKRHGVNGSELVVRRLKLTPKLPMPYVFSEAGENTIHKYGIYWEPNKARVLKSPRGQVIELFMSSSHLGWLKVQAVTDESTVLEMLKQYKRDQSMGTPHLAMIDALVSTSLACPMDPAAVRTVNMGKVKALTGVELLRRRHITDGHASLPVTVKNLKAEGAFERKLITLKDVELFAAQGCGACELTKMRRRPFTTKVEQDAAPPKLGKLFTFDVLQLRVPAEHTGATHLYLAIEKVSKFAIGGSMRGYSEAHVVSTLNELKARVRPTHGEIEVLRADSHPTHRSKHVRDYLLSAQQHLQLSPAYVHEGVGDVENFFLHNVPSANALLKAAPDLGENHFAQALFYVIDAKNHSVTANSNPPRSPAMVYHALDKLRPSGLMVFGAAAMALVHGEARDSKFDDHAEPCVYVGPPINSDSRAHCAVWHKREYKDVDLGCISVNENTVIERTRREHVNNQPYNQVAAAKPVDVGKPTSILDLSGMDYKEEDLPKFVAVVWVRSMDLPQEDFALLLWHGEPRAGDMTSWVLELSNKVVTPYPIDLRIGGQEHNLARKPIKEAILKMNGSKHCLATFQQPECGPFSASRYEQPGPPVLFDKNNVDGIPDEDGELPFEVQQAINDVRFCADLFRQTMGTDKVCMLEYPASQGAGSPFGAKGRELHSTIADTSIMSTLIAELGLEIVFTEQGASGAASRKPTAILTTKNGAHPLRRTVGTLFVEPGTKFDKVIGEQNEDGVYKTKALGRYTPKFAMQLSIALVESLPRQTRDARLRAESDKQAEPATDNLYPTGARVELYWYGEQRWYRGTVVDTRIRKGMVHGASIARREIQVRYDDDESVLWHAICDYAVRKVPAEVNEPEEVVLAALAARADADAAAETLCALDAEATPPVVFDGEAVRATGTTPDASAVSNPSQDDDAAAPPLEAHLGEMFTVRRLLFDLETEESVGREVFYAVLGDGSVAEIDVSGAQSWHVPQNEKEYARSPQRDLWRSAKEIKMDEYASIDMYDLVLESSVDKTKYKIYDTLWAYKIKFKKGAGGSTIFDKLNPRWCVMGGGMDRALYKSWAEQARATSVNIMWGMKGLYYKKLAAGQFDMKNAFQSTRTVDKEGNLLDGENEFYTRQAPGFVKYGPNGETLVCRQKCFIQGRIDATRGFDKFITDILIKECNLAPLLWDNKLYQYNNTPLAGTTASLDEIIDKATEMHLAGVDTDAQQPPSGLGLFAMHVDDLGALATGCLVVQDNRIFNFVRGKIEVAYAVKLTAWDKLLGFETHLDDENETVTITAQAAVDGVRARLFSKEILTITPRHAVTENVYESCPGTVPDVNDPARARYLENQELVRHVLGVGIWMTNAYPQMGAAINSMCVNMASPGMERLGQLRHLFMYLGEKPQGKIFGGKHVTGCCAGVKEVAPFTTGAKSGEYHYFSDASINVTGGVGMFAGCCIQPLMLRQHLASPSAHTSEIVAAGTNMNHVLPVNGVLQELHIRQGRPTRMYFDSQSTVYVASSDTAPKKSVWLARRNKVLTECVEHGEVEPIHIGEADMVADSFTKYVKRETWTRHMHYILNLPGDDCHGADWVRVPTVKSKPKNKTKPKVIHKA